MQEADNNPFSVVVKMLLLHCLLVVCSAKTLPSVANVHEESSHRGPDQSITQQ